MYIYLLSFSVLVGLLMFRLFFLPGKRKSKKIRILKNQNDTSEAEYAINEHGFLERIHHDKVSKH